VKRTEEKVFALFPRLAERRSQLAGSLSGGEQQMLAIGRALMANPDMIVIDEPSLGLAPNIVDSIYDMILDLNKQGITILIVEQNAELALDICTRAYLISGGQVKLEGYPDVLRQSTDLFHS
jgi:branched-chain amino acid transport system ATP-binding protein